MMKLTDIHADLQKKLEQVKNLRNLATKELLKYQEEGRLRIGHSNGSAQYFQCSEELGTYGQYISKKELAKIKTLANKDYYKKVIKLAENQINWLENTLSKMPKEDLHEIYRDNQDRRKLINPYFLTDEEFIQQWESKPYTGKEFEEGSTEIYTDEGERVRSKSEKIIADKLCKMRIPYRYEYPLAIKGFGTIYPDFTVLNVSQRKEIILEHFGMMDNLQYCTSALDKITLYEMNGFYPGDNLIITYETGTKPINTRLLQRTIEKYCV